MKIILIIIPVLVILGLLYFFYIKPKMDKEKSNVEPGKDDNTIPVNEITISELMETYGGNIQQHEASRS